MAKISPGDRAISALSRFLGNVPDDLPSGFANGLLSRSSVVILISRGVAKLPGDLHTGFAHRLLSQGSEVMHLSESSLSEGLSEVRAFTSIIIQICKYNRAILQ